MKISLTWGDVRNEIFLGVVQRMINARLPFPVTTKLLRLAKTINDERTLSQTVLDKLADESSEVIKEEGKPDFKAIKKDLQESFHAEVVKLLGTRFEVRMDKIDPEHLKGLELSVNELLAISPLLIDGEQLSELEQKTPPPPAAPVYEKIPETAAPATV